MRHRSARRLAATRSWCGTQHERIRQCRRATAAARENADEDAVRRRRIHVAIRFAEEGVHLSGPLHFGRRVEWRCAQPRRGETARASIRGIPAEWAGGNPTLHQRFRRSDKIEVALAECRHGERARCEVAQVPMDVRRDGTNAFRQREKPRTRAADTTGRRANSERRSAAGWRLDQRAIRDSRPCRALADRAPMPVAREATGIGWIIARCERDHSTRILNGQSFDTIRDAAHASIGHRRSHAERIRQRRAAERFLHLDRRDIGRSVAHRAPDDVERSDRRSTAPAPLRARLVRQRRHRGDDDDE